jgi:hypothetical protein
MQQQQQQQQQQQTTKAVDIHSNTSIAAVAATKKLATKTTATG